MTEESTSTTTAPPTTLDRWILRAIVLGVVAGIPFVLALLGVVRPELAVLGALALLGGVAVLASPELSVFAAMFLLYGNYPAILHRFHGLPQLVGVSVPLLLVIAAMPRVLARRHGGFILTPIMPWLLLFFAVQLVGLVLAIDSGPPKETIQTFVLEGLVIFITIVNAVRDMPTLRAAIWGIVLAGFIMGAVPAYQQVTKSFYNDFGGLAQTDEGEFEHHSKDTGKKSVQVRLAGPIGEKNRYSQAMLVIVPLGIYLAAAERRKFLKIVALASAGFAAIGFALAFSRGGAVAAVLTLGLAYSIGAIRLKHVGYAALASLVVLAFLPQYAIRLASIVGVGELFKGEQASAPVEGAIAGRATEMLGAAMAYVDYPVVGVGPGMFKYYAIEYSTVIGIHRLDTPRPAHSLYLEVAAQNGTLGVIAFGAMLLLPLLALNRARVRWAERAPPFSLIATGGIMMLSSYYASAVFLHMAYERYFYCILALAAAAAELGRRAEVSEDLLGDSLADAPESGVTGTEN